MHRLFAPLVVSLTVACSSMPDEPIPDAGGALDGSSPDAFVDAAPTGADATADASAEAGDAALDAPVVTATGPGPHEPSGFTKVSGNPFDALPPDNPKVDVYGYTKYYGTTNLSILSDGTAPASPPNFLRLLFPAGHGGGDAPNAFVAGDLAGSGPKTRFYTRIRFRVSSNWTDNGNAGTKFFFFDQSQGNNHYVGLTEQGQLRLAVNLQSTFGYATPSGPNHLGTSLTKGTWHDAEILIVANTPGKYDGIARVWVDGTKTIDATDMGYFALGQTAHFDGFWFNPTYGGGYNPVPANQSLDLDHWYTSAAP
jgi:hypothetical protein